MKKWIILVLVIGVVGAAWWKARQMRFVPPWQQAKVVTITRGDIRVPITAMGLIQPAATIEIKSKASGEVIEVRVQPGDFVRANDILVVLERDDEERNRDRAKDDLTLAEAARDSAIIQIDDAEQAVEIAEANLERLVAQFPVVEKEWEIAETDRESGRYSELDFARRKAAYETNLAEQRGLKARLTQAKSGVEQAKLTVKQREAALGKARIMLKDAEKRLRETEIRATIDAMVTDVRVQRGEKVQSATTSFGVGTSLVVLADVSKLKVVALVDEADIGRIQAIAPLGSLPQMSPDARAERIASELKERSGKVTLMVDAFPDPETKFEGVIERVEPQGRANPGAAVIQFRVHVEITDARREQLPLGAQAQVEFTVESAVNVLTVPSEAIKSFEDRHGVWRVVKAAPGERGRGKKFIPCQLGLTDGERTEIIRALDGSELKEGMKVYTKLPPEETDED